MSFRYSLFIILRLMLAILMVLAILILSLRLYGSHQSYLRLNHEVLNKISNNIHLQEKNGSFVLNLQDPSAHPRLAQTQIIRLKDKQDTYTIDPNMQCFFLFIHFDSAETKVYDSIIEPLHKKDCVFIQSPYEDVIKNFSKAKPRWFYGIRYSQWIQFIFLNSMGLETIAPLKGDFLVLDSKQPEQIHPRILKELQRRKKIIFIKNTHP